MGLIITYLILLLTGGVCIGYTIWEHKKCKKRDIDIENENEALRSTNQKLSQISSDLSLEIEKKKYEDAQLLNSIQLNFKQNDELFKKQENLKNIINELTEQKQIIGESLVKTMTQNDTLLTQNKQLEARIDALNHTINELSNNQQAAMRTAFEQYCDALELEYSKAETEYDTLIELLQRTYDSEMEHLHKIFQREEHMYKEDIAFIKQELDKIKATRAAAMEAQLREEEIKNQATFYTLQLNEADKRDVAYLQSIEYNLREARPLRMLIWSTFYRDKVNDLAARVGALGASGIYKLTHIDSGISYIGQAKDIKERWVTHVKCSLGIDTPVTSQLYAFTREKGIDNFTFEILEKCSINELNEKERFYIDLYQTYDFGLNKTRGNG